MSGWGAQPGRRARKDSMVHRVANRRAAWAGAVLAAGIAVAVAAVPVLPAAPAVAHDADAPPGVSALEQQDEAGYLARTFADRGCDGIVGGAQPGVDGWVFQEPVAGWTEKVYGLLFAASDPAGSAAAVVELRVDAAGVRAVDVSDTRSMVEDVRKTPVTSTAGQTAADILVMALPAGVTGGLIDNGGAWLRTPAGWRLVDGALHHGNVYDSPAEFVLEQVCVDGPAPSATAAAAPGASVDPVGAAPTQRGTDGQPGPVALAGGAGALLAGAVAALLIVRRRHRAGDRRRTAS
ncbi:MAG TPA: hypothetical protein VK453_17350 [Micromonosporaceae bacterium]|nr:hypothetical protein [Micromonosporaceae bacterium]